MKKNRLCYYALIISLGVLYFFGVGEHGPILLKDSNAFLYSSKGLPTGYWLYPRFLQLCRNLFSENYYLYAVHIIQGFFAIITSFSLTEFIRKEFNLCDFGAIIVYVLTFLPYGYSLPENVSSHHILTEGLAIPFYYLLMLFSLKIVFQEKKRYMILALLLAFLLSKLRPQLLVTIVIELILIIWKVCQIIYSQMDRKGKTILKALISIGICALVVVACLGFSNIIKRSKWSQFSEAVTGRTLCLMEYEDRILFAGETKEVFDTLFLHVDKRGNLLKHIDDNPKRGEKLIYIINENTKDWKIVIQEYIDKKYGDEGYPAEISEYSIRDEIVINLFREHWKEYVMMTFQLLPYGLVASIFIQPDSFYSLCHIFAYAIYFVVAILLFLSKKKYRCEEKYRMPMYITLLFLLINVFVVNIVFFGLQRYVIYSFGMFYISGLVLVVGIYRKRRDKGGLDT